jgi:glycerophosphoryl diester phosphodiesterase
VARVIAHRGGPGLPGNEGIENTLAAFARAAAAGYGLETDVRASADGVPVLHHDRDLLRTSGDPREVGALAWRELGRVLVGGREPLARLDDLLDAVPDVSVNVDVKDRGAVAATIRAIRRTGGTARVTVASFSPVRAARTRYALGHSVTWSATPVEIAAVVAAARTGAARLAEPFVRRLVRRVDCLQIPVSLATGHDGPGLVGVAHGLGLEVHVWTVDGPELAGTLADAGIDALISDRPDVVAAALQENR